MESTIGPAMSPIFTLLLLAAGLTVFGITMYGRLRVLASMKKEDRFDHAPIRAEALVLFGLGQKRMVDPEERGPGVMHALIFAAFMVLALRTIMLFAMGLSDSALQILSTPTDPFWTEHHTLLTVFNAYSWVKDLLAAGAIIGAAYFWYLRWRVKPDRMTPSWEGYLILGLIIGLMVTEFTFGASHFVDPQREFTWWEPVTSAIAAGLRGFPTFVSMALGAIAFWLHLTIILVFLNFLPYGKHFHV